MGELHNMGVRPDPRQVFRNAIIRSPEAEAYWRERFAREKMEEMERMVKAAFVRGNKREGSR